MTAYALQLRSIRLKTALFFWAVICSALISLSPDVNAAPTSIETPFSVTASQSDRNYVLLAAAQPETPANSGSKQQPGAADEFKDDEQELVPDPLEPFNRVMFGFNDRLYFIIMKPFYSVYNAVLPQDVRIAGRNFFQNLTMPVRFVSCLIQLRLECSAVEMARFVINSTVGLGGLFDVAAMGDINLKQNDADIGLALAHYKIGEIMYLVLPFMGPSTLRDTIGSVGDHFLNPLTYLEPWELSLGLSAFNFVNRASFHGQDYEDLVKAAIDPYAAVKDAYIQYRRGKVK